jgi:hypothetical protein
MSVSNQHHCSETATVLLGPYIMPPLRASGKDPLEPRLRFAQRHG